VAATLNWFYMNGDEKVGPISQDQLCDLFRKGILTVETLVRSEAFRNWTPASSIAALRTLCTAARPAPAAAATIVTSDGGAANVRPPLDYESAADAGPIGIRGWLILPAIGMFLNPLGYILSTVMLWSIAMKVRTTPGAANWALSIRIVAGMTVLFVIYQLYTAVLFFSKKASAPAAVIFVYVGNILMSFASIWVLRPILQYDEVNPSAIWRGMLRSLVIALIWIPYFRTSKRVKRTFVN
jgi:hypothetical protein